MKKFFLGIPKVFFAIICYLSALLLAILSGYFSIVFYAESQTGWNRWAMGGLAGMLEFIKMMLATAFPFLQYRDIKREKKVSFYLKICFILSVMASMYFFLSGGEIERSPASNITKLLYTYIPLLDVIPLQFSQFITTMSLSILVEAFIIFLPILAPIMFIEKDPSRKRKVEAATSFEKLKEIVTVIPERAIDKLHRKVIGEESKRFETENIKVEETKNNTAAIEMNDKPKLKLLKGSSKIEDDYEDDYEDDPDEYLEEDSITVLENGDEQGFIQNSEMDKQKVLSVIYKFKLENVCPSVKQLMDHTGLNKRSVHNIKKEFENSGILKTEGRKTILLCDYNDALEKIWA
ncbi:MAG: hypothetical protein JW924_03705 [Fusobacteriaceae bacterium]|nr:hypothetical protein [Fusobacteriaceae bacterium]